MNITLKIKIGEINAIIGPSGAGKSTLVDLLSKIITPSKGNVYFDDHDCVVHIVDGEDPPSTKERC